MSYTRWNHDENVSLAHTAAEHSLRGLNELTAFRMAVTQMPKSRRRNLATVQNVPAEARAIYKTRLKELERNNTAKVHVQETESHEVGRKYLEDEVAELRATNQQLVTLVRQNNERIGNLETLVRELLCDLRGVPVPVEEPEEKKEKRQLRIAVLGLKPEQLNIIKRDFPHVKFSATMDGSDKVPADVCLHNDAVICTRWNNMTVWDKIKHHTNAYWIGGGMTAIRERINQTIDIQNIKG